MRYLPLGAEQRALIGQGLETCYPIEKEHSLQRRMRFVLRSWVLGAANTAWFRTVYASPVLLRMLDLQKDLIERIHRPVSRRYLSVADRAQLLMSHYAFVESRFNEAFVSSVLVGGGGLLTELEGKGGSRYQIILKHEHRYCKEGELTLEFLDSDGEFLAVLSFSFRQAVDGLEIHVGGVQGGRVEDTRERIRVVTRNLYHIQPRHALVEALRRIAQSLGVCRIDCVSNANHVYRTLRYRNKIIQANYDTLWISLQGVLSNNNDYRLPLVIHHHKPEELPSNRRSEYRRKLAVLEQLQAQTEQHLSAWFN